MASLNRKQRILFYYLSAFKFTGGIEKFNRSFIKALNDLNEHGIHSDLVSVYDDQNCDVTYNYRLKLQGFAEDKAKSVIYVLKASFKSDVVVLGHINLAIAGVLIKLFRPSCKVVLIAHGIEVWGRLGFFKKWCIKTADTILAVSNYTKNQLVLRNDIKPEKIVLFPNTIDPFFVLPENFDKPDYLLKRYGVTNDQPVIFTLSRLSSSERYKGYDRIFEALPDILHQHPNAIYILAGKYDMGEKKRIDELLKLHGVEKKVIITGYVPEEEVSDHYKLADVFIMPSRKEGFGIVFLEAIACGTSVIGGNQDGTVDALLNGSAGILINPTKVPLIAKSVIEQVKNKASLNPHLMQDRILQAYGFDKYKARLHKIIKERLQ